MASGLAPGLASAQTSEDSGWFSPGEPAVPARPADTQAPAGALLEPADSDAADTDPRALSDFRPLLSKYGDWIEDARYGLVWVPGRRWVGDDFAPYLTRGRWALDTAGEWVWVSDYAFGKVVFHYGRWVWVVGLGWAWVPGYRYAPAWVHWRVPLHDGLYVGWAPMPPSYVWVSGVAVGVGFYVGSPWVFCPSYYLFSPHVHHHHVHDPSRMKEAARQTKPYNPENGARGPSPAALGVPRSRVPVSRLPAQPRPATPVDALRRQGALPRAPSADWRRSASGPTIDTGAPSPSSSSASARTGAQSRSSARPASSLPSSRVPRPYSIAPRAAREAVGSAWRTPGSSLPSSGQRYTPGASQQGRVVVPRATVVPQGVAPPRAPARVAPR